jgi:pimeloyl-ACP methyl ester carboxylesterase
MQLNSKAFLERAMLLGSRGNASTRLVVNALSDALAYRAERPVGKNIFALMDYQVSQLRGQPVHFLGHSLGALINADYLRTRPDIRIGSMQTFGTNIPLFTLGDKFDVPARLKVGKVPWYNWLYASDCMGYPLCTLSELEHVKDIILDEAAGWRWSYLIPGLSHVDYFSDKVFAQQLAQTMMKL